MESEAQAAFHPHLPPPPALTSAWMMFQAFFSPRCSPSCTGAGLLQSFLGVLIHLSGEGRLRLGLRGDQEGCPSPQVAQE